MRSIISDDEELQVQGDENGREYVYRKDYLRTGDQRNEYSLSLVYSRQGKILSVGPMRIDAHGVEELYGG